MVTKFGCDYGSCRKEITASSFPYDEGWVYFYRFEFKMIQNLNDLGKEVLPETEKIVGQITEKDKHFCSNFCASEWVRKTLKG